MSSQQVYDQQSAEQNVSAHQRSRSSTANTLSSGRAGSRPKSRGSTTSLQSMEVGGSFQPQQHVGIDHPTTFMQHPNNQQQQAYQQNPEAILLQYGQQLAQPQPASIDPSLGMPPQNMRPMSQNGFPEMPPYPMHYPNGMPQYNLPQQHLHHMRHQSEQFEGSPAPEDSENADNNGGAKRRRGTASSLANDQELRRLLGQYQGRSLKDVAAEVQKNEGGGGKSEKAKQVFAMLWLQESCRRSSNSVRRDRVFSRYTERCGNERVPTLNPASFGKLVRIIFPNVQTRRLGVRGESKYHYVDLSLYPEDTESALSHYPNDEPPIEYHHRSDSTSTVNKVFQSHARSVSVPQPQPAMDTADFPPPSASFLPRQPVSEKQQMPAPVVTMTPRLDCLYQNTPMVRIPTNDMSATLVTALPSVRNNLPATLSAYLAMPSLNSLNAIPPSTQDSLIDLPDIHAYLKSENYDFSIANSLSHLYRSYCIDVIDAFRTCKEKPFFNHHAAFNGKMTVPVAKLFALEALAPWIQECDMRMYKQMIRFITPLVMQVVPDPVWGVFDRVSAKLVAHLVSAFEEKCPLHVVVAKVVPAARFSNLLKKLKSANTAASYLSTVLGEGKTRTQMWIDFVSLVDPERVIDDSIPPSESISAVEGILRDDLKNLIAPLDNDDIPVMEEDPSNAFSNFLNKHSPDFNHYGVMPSSALDEPSVGLLDRWLQWLERIPQAFEGHSPQCLITWHNGFWKSILTQMGVGGASTYQAWWYLEAFLSGMMSWMTQREGLLMDEQGQRELERREQVKRAQNEGADVNVTIGANGRSSSRGQPPILKRKRIEQDTSGEERQSTNHTPSLDQLPRPRPPFARSQTMPVLTPSFNLDGAFDQPDHHHTRDSNENDNDTDDDMDEIRRSGPLDLPSISLRITSSPMKATAGHPLQNQSHDDSGIDMRADVDGDGLGLGIGWGDGLKGEDHLKRIKREWGILSDSADGEGEVVVI